MIGCPASGWELMETIVGERGNSPLRAYYLLV